MNVELRHLRALAAIGDEGTITDAAATLHVSQPALSRTLEQLEHRLGTRLVERTTRSLALTDAGRRLWEHAHRILAQLDDALAEAAAGPRPLRVGFGWAALGRHTLPLLRGWREARPGTPVRVRRCDDPEVALRKGEVDIAFMRTQPSDTALASRVLYQEHRIAAVPQGNPLADKEVLHLADLAGEPVALCSTAATTSADLWPEGMRPDTFEVPGVDEWLTTIALGEAVGVTTEATVHSHPHPDIRYLPLADAATVTVRLVWPRRPTHAATGAFREHAVSALR
ncbi:LysR family transcriptional regulator [Saccharothrix sp.]|uniref:LysR family transcriptional regulator n=1 Tax=Saccharothrix sp. TaxID=1873460 RepID=UPI0028111196|nr:LysR family transcriptional regulator [Saccharothrix sp.]